MTHLLRGELTKALTTRTLFAFAAAGVALTVVNVLIVAVASGVLDEVGEKEEALSGLPIVPLLLGLVGVAGEYRHRTAAPAVLAAGRNRGRLLLARVSAYALIGVGVGALMVGASLALGLPLLGDQPGPDLTGRAIAGVAGSCFVAAVLSVVVGASIGALVRSQVGGVVVVLILNFIVNPLISGVDETLANLTPFGAAGVAARLTHDTTVSPGAGALALAAWAALLVTAATLIERRRDLV